MRQIYEEKPLAELLRGTGRVSWLAIRLAWRASATTCGRYSGADGAFGCAGATHTLPVARRDRPRRP